MKWCTVAYHHAGFKRDATSEKSISRQWLRNVSDDGVSCCFWVHNHAFSRRTAAYMAWRSAQQGGEALSRVADQIIAGIVEALPAQMSQIQLYDWCAGASLSGPACNATFQEVPWTSEVFVRGRSRDDSSGVGAPHAPVLATGAVRMYDPADKAEDLRNAAGAVRNARGACVEHAFGGLVCGNVTKK